MEARPALQDRFTPFLIWALILVALYLSSLYTYLLFHSLAELFSVVIAVGVFAIAWNSRRFLENNYLLFLGIAYLFVGVMDLFHTLAYKGMEVFPGFGSNLATQLWIAARYLESFSLLLAPWFLNRRLNVRAVFAAYALLFSLLLALIFSGVFPVCYVEGVGLTPFKKISEYVICFILAGALAYLWQMRHEFDPEVVRLLVCSILLTIGSELAFTFYVSVYGISNFIGHIFKILSFYLIYKALIETGLVKPYNLLFRNLKRSEEALRTERDFVDSLIETAQVIILVLDSQGRIVRFNPYLEEISGYRLADVQGQDWIGTFLPARDRDSIRQLFLQSVSSVRRLSHVNPIVTKDGREREIEWFNRVLEDEAGKIIGLLAIGQDITERKRALEALKGEKDFVSALLDTVGALVVVLDRRGYIVRFNQTCERLTGYSFSEVKKAPFWDILLLPEEVAGVKEVFQKLQSGNFPQSYENYWVTKDERRRLITWSNTALLNDDGSVRYVIATGLDVTEKKEAELHLNRQRAILDGINRFKDALACDTETELWQACLAIAENLTGSKFGFIDELNPGGRMDVVAMSGPGWETCRVPRSGPGLDHLKDLELRGLVGQVFLEEQSLITNDPSSPQAGTGSPEGHPPMNAYLGVPLKHEGKVIGVIGLANKEGGYDQTDREAVETLAVAMVEALMRKRAERQVRELNAELELRIREVSQRRAELEAANKELESFSYSVSHDLRSPLRGISGFARILEQDYGPQLEAQGLGYLHKIQDSARQMAELIDALLTLSRTMRAPMRRTQVHLSSLARAVAEDLKNSDPGRQVEFVIAPDLVAAGDPPMLLAVLRNLLDNAWKFTGKVPGARIEFGARPQENGCQVYFVRDNGAGFDMNYANKLFRAFQRLHPVGDFPGTGIGLATVQRVIERHGGRVWAEGAVDQGATFYFTLEREAANEVKEG